VRNTDELEYAWVFRTHFSSILRTVFLVVNDRCVLRWDFDGQKLTLAFIEPDKHPAEERLITEHTYQKTK
jgi:hypothetical protein